MLWLRPLVNDKVAMGQIYHPLENKVFDRVVLKTRGRMGSDSVAKNDTLRWILGNKRDGRPTILGYINDQVPKWENIHHWLTFLNHETRLPSILMSSMWDAGAMSACSTSSRATRQGWASLN